MTPRKAAIEMAHMLYSDSLIPITESYRPILEALAADRRVPDLYEMECLTLGGPLTAAITPDQPETNGEGNPEVDARFPMTAAAIGKLF